MEFVGTICPVFSITGMTIYKGRIIGSFLMISGIAIIGGPISTLGAGLVESRMKKITIEDTRKIAIKERIHNLEEMDEDENQIIDRFNKHFA